jgi:hypothetical protein
MRKVLMLIFMLILSLPSLCLAQTTDNHTIPEPATLLLLGSGLAGIGALKMWRRIKSKR